MSNLTTAPGRASASPAAREPIPSPTANLLYEAFYGGAFGGSVIALFFLIIDFFKGQPLWTPSLVGTALFTGADPHTVALVRYDMVAYFTIVHFAAFGLLGAFISRLSHRSRLIDQHVLVMAGAVFLVLTAAILLGDALLMHGIVSAIGTASVLIGNAITGLVMAAFMQSAHEKERALGAFD